MLKKYAQKVSNTLSTINHMRPKSNSSRSSTSEDDNVTCTCDCDYNLMEVNRELFIENYLIGRGASKTRSSSLSYADDACEDAALRRNNNRRKSFSEKRDRLKINRNHLFGDKADVADRAKTRHKISVNMSDDYYEMDDEKSRGCDFMETSALKKVNNNLREFVDVELSIGFLPAVNLHLNGKPAPRASAESLD